MTTHENLLHDSLLLIWNDRDPSSRLAAMQQIYDPEIRFYENKDGGAIVGIDAVNARIAGLQAEWHPDFRFQIRGRAQINHEVQHAGWQLGIPGEAPVASGMDIAITANGSIRELYLFLD